jgi:hypothetical protein
MAAASSSLTQRNVVSIEERNPVVETVSAPIPVSVPKGVSLPAYRPLKGSQAQFKK